MNDENIQFESRWPHRLALALVCATLPLISVGGLVTTIEAGMSVPDWPNTYGYNLFLYPWQEWIYGPGHLFVEHFHRLIGAVVGFITIALVIAVWRCDRPARRWMRAVAIAALVLVIVQGTLGGVRILAADPRMAMIHGCVGPLFFGLCAAMAVFLSPLWTSQQPRRLDRGASKLHRLAVMTLALAYVQLVLGALVRHVPVTASPGTFRAALFLHLFMAFLLTLHIAMLCRHVWANFRDTAALRRPAVAMTTLIIVQLTLGAATWVFKYGWPSWVGEHAWNAGFVVLADSTMQVGIVTAHVATGSLILATSVVLAARGLRLTRGVAVGQRDISSITVGVVA